MLKLISRLLTGAVFVFSGFVKAVDPKGSAIKIAEYLEVIGIHNSNGIAIILSIALSSIEFILGFHLLLGFRLKRVALPALLFMAGFTIITFFIAIFEPVSDCGCFGDAIKLSNWETLSKNLIILPFSIIVYYRRNDYKSNLSGGRQFLLTSTGLLFIIGISVYSMYCLPLLDFRPYHIGANIPEKMSIPEGADEGEYETTFILEKDGERKEFDVDDYPYNDSTWIFIDSKTKIIREGYQPPITALHFTSTEGDDITDAIINNEQPVFLMVAPKLENTSTDNIQQFINIKSVAQKHSSYFYLATASLTEDCYKFDMAHQAAFEYAQCDETTLKTIIRANPGLVIIQKGTIIAKYSYTQLPDAETLKNPLSQSIQSMQRAHDKTWLWLCLSVITGLIIIIYKFK
ncbi:DoxX family protein [Carboxylicivirga sediminis]|uniref:DoxX family protein n=1 Tax=Carboxylicivirga sediminis TaxID=2006564 RepID=A0A941F756_9BACT|nr:BT_3928 family protein [Carboxylicivirga sediminis]MBR8537692.1 DoxX family protein [Carboxylicivirga sediminis]